jgi:hypothetical protein
MVWTHIYCFSFSNYVFNYFSFSINKAKHLIQIAILGSQVIGRAFTRALRQELQCINKILIFIVFIF